ncbi:hypothetical protein [Isoptericola sp. NPDC058082]|uniref:hypothetical protein n=1 Tax=Isoptericola sp. NPDC058082 TaxID=3346331 RepID=UPI0036EFBD40
MAEVIRRVIHAQGIDFVDDASTIDGKYGEISETVEVGMVNGDTHIFVATQHSTLSARLVSGGALEVRYGLEARTYSPTGWAYVEGATQERR